MSHPDPIDERLREIREKAERHQDQLDLDWDPDDTRMFDPIWYHDAVQDSLNDIAVLFDQIDSLRKVERDNERLRDRLEVIANCDGPVTDDDGRPIPGSYAVHPAIRRIALDATHRPPAERNPCQGRCEFHGKLWCIETGGKCEDYADATHRPPLNDADD